MQLCSTSMPLDAILSRLYCSFGQLSLSTYDLGFSKVLPDNGNAKAFVTQIKKTSIAPSVYHLMVIIH